MGLTVEYLSLSRYLPDFSEELHIWMNDVLVICAQHFSNLQEVPLHSAEFFGLNDFIIFIISISVVDIDFISAVLSVFNLFNSFISIRKFCY